MSCSGREYGLAFETAQTALEVHVAYAEGFHDHGERLLSWKNVRKLADVTVGASFATVTLPEDIAVGGRALRFFLCRPAASTDYVSDGLIAQFDGIDNALGQDGIRIHDPAAASWADLTGGEAASFTSGKCTVVEKGVRATCSHISETSAGIVTRSFGADAIHTIEVVATPLSGVANKCDSALWTGNPTAAARVSKWKSESDVLQVGFRSNGEIIDKYHYGRWNERVALTYTREEASQVAWTNGVRTKTSCAYTPTSGAISLGNLPGYERGIDAVYHAVRLYSRALSAEEIGRNNEIDGARFGDLNLISVGCSEVTSVASSPTDIVELSLIGRTVTLSFPSDEAARGVYVAWGPDDGGETTNGWLHVEKLGEVASGATAFVGTVPDRVADGRAHYRYFLDETVTYGDYRLEGARSVWDGILNDVTGGRPCHNPSARTHWTDLVNTGADKACVVDESLARVVGNGYEIDTRNSNRPALKSSYVYGTETIRAVEVAVTVEDDQGTTDDAALMSFDGDSGCTPPVRIGARRKFGRMILAPTLGNGGLVDAFATNYWRSTLTVAYLRTGESAWAAFVDGVDTGCRIEYPTGGSYLIFGALKGNAVMRGLRATVHAIRLYTTAPGVAALGVNAAVDSRRFARPFRCSTLRAPTSAGNVRPVLVESQTPATGCPVSATLSFPACDRATELYVAVGRTDAGLDDAGWRRLIKLADVPAGARTVSCDLPADLASLGRHYRFLIGAVPDASAYVAKGLIANFDGLQNGIDDFGKLGHSSFVTSWTNLCGGAAATFTAGCYAVTNDGILARCAGWNVLTAGIVTGPYGKDDIGTIEVLATPVGGLNNKNDSTLWTGDSMAESPVASARVGAWSPDDESLQVGFYSNGGIKEKYYDGVWRKTVGLTYTRTGNLHAAWTNGVATGVSYSFTPVAGHISFGNLPEHERGLNAVYHSVRLYDRPLTAEEIVRNREIDEARFGSGFVWGGSEPYDLPVQSLLLIVR